MKKKVLDIISSILKSESFSIKEKIKPSTVLNKLPFWDSFKHVEFLIKIEGHFKIEIKAGDASKIKSVKDIINLLKEYDCSKASQKN